MKTLGLWLLGWWIACMGLFVILAAVAKWGAR